MNRPVSADDSNHYSWGGFCDGWHLLQRDDLSVIQERVPAGGAEFMHFHHVSRQFFYMLAGQAILIVEGQRVSLTAGQGLEIPPGVPHQFRNESDSEVHFLVVSMPASHGDRVEL